ncbi:RNA polymerase sigma factor [Chitinophaga arvensicola]|uniref:RNA polymerase sigma-70 factor, ECF subfamily n=1 Tax=Chitinophaga arvensicola TaxID=29529 RepID=A0A1I0RG18_9BACT|nr:RNA polymerase sigma factor [Chitinophaga arvensicola]SEW39853.1 RNA polymerase sigma-70 factor, ECF subfamily [Chitinophaga arvensicola]
MNPADKSERFLAVLQAHKGIIYKIAHSYCHQAADRPDLIQEIMVQLWRSFENYNGAAAYSTWIYRIALNVAISFYRKDSRRQHVAHPLSAEMLNMTAPPVADESSEQLAFLQRFIAELKDLDKALMLLYLEEKSYREIAEIMGLSETNVATKVARIKGVLKQKFLSIKSQ